MALYENRIRGSFYGCAIGDALGAPLEFSDRDEHPTVTEMQYLEHFKLPAGSWTDDTSMMLCLSASLVATGGKCDANSEVQHYLEWFDSGYLSVAGYSFDVGRTTIVALHEFEKTWNPIAPTNKERFCGNGSLMRIAPIPIIALGNIDHAYEWAQRSSETTHAHPLCKEACGIYAALITRAIVGDSKEQLLEVCKSMRSRITESRLITICDTEFLHKSRDQILSYGYVLYTIEAALWTFFKTNTFEEGAILVVNLGHDADTVGSVYGTLAGAFYGAESIPERWMNALQGRHMLDGVFTDLIELTYSLSGTNKN